MNDGILSDTAGHRVAEEKIAEWPGAPTEPHTLELHQRAGLDSQFRQARHDAAVKSLGADQIGAAVAEFTLDHEITRIPDNLGFRLRQGNKHVRTALVASAVFSALCVGLIVGLNWNRVFGAISLPLQPDRNGSARATGVSVLAKADREETSNPPKFGGTPTATITGAGRHPDSPQAESPPPTSSNAPVSSVTRQNGAASGPSSVDIEHRAKVLPRRRQPIPETKPATIDGWTVREVVGGTAVLVGPGGIWRATRGDTVPGVGKVDAIVRWGSYWIVATSSGLISTQ